MLEIYQFVFADGVFHSIGIPIRAESSYKNPTISNLQCAAVNATIQQYRILNDDVTDPYRTGIYKILQLQFAEVTGRVQFTIAYSIDGYLHSEGDYNYLKWSTKWPQPVHHILVQQFFPMSLIVEPGMYSTNWTSTSTTFAKTELPAMQRFAIVTKLTQHVPSCKETAAWSGGIRTSYHCIGWQCRGTWNRYHLVWLLLVLGIVLAMLLCATLFICSATTSSNVTVVDSGPWWMFFLPAALMPVAWYAPYDYYGGGEYVTETTEFIGGNEANFGDAGFGDAD